MTVNAEGYFDCLRSYLNMGYYALPVKDNKITLKEKVFTETGDKTIEIQLSFDGDVFGIKLDKKNGNGNAVPLFHFLEDESKPWAPRCDFILFHCHKSKIKIYLFEFKSTSIAAESIVRQLNAGECWCRSLAQVVKTYTGKSRKMVLSKFVFTLSTNPSVYLDQSGKYLKADSAIRHYHYDQVRGINLKDLENSHTETIH